MTVLMGQAYPAARGADAGSKAPTVRESFRAELAQLQAPVGHRQPTQNDIPPSVREEEAPSTGAAPQSDSQGGGVAGGEMKEKRRTPRGRATHLRPVLTSGIIIRATKMDFRSQA
jgi:hypothetical protein